MGMFERFFHVAMILTIMLIACNMSLMIFSPSLLGKNVGEKSLVTSIKDTSTTGFPVVSKITQTTLNPVFSALDATLGIGNVINFIVNLIGHYRITLQEIFVGIDPTQQCSYALTFPIGECNDTPELFGAMLLNLVLIFQIIGLIYLPFAIWGAFVGGGSP